MIFHLPVSMATAAVSALFYVFLSLRVILARAEHRISLGGDDNPALHLRMRIHANFAEYVPLALILMALVELSGGSRHVLAGLAVLLVLSRVAHFLGMPREAPNFLRAGGILGTFLVLAAESLYGLWLLAAPAPS